MTTITFCAGRERSERETQKAGDEICGDDAGTHDANVAPWRALEEKDVVIRQVDIREE